MSYRQCISEEVEWYEIELPIMHDPRALLEEVALILAQSDKDTIHSIASDGCDEDTAIYTVILHA